MVNESGGRVIEAWVLECVKRVDLSVLPEEAATSLWLGSKLGIDHSSLGLLRGHLGIPVKRNSDIQPESQTPVCQTSRRGESDIPARRVRHAESQTTLDDTHQDAWNGTLGTTIPAGRDGRDGRRDEVGTVGTVGRVGTVGMVGMVETAGTVGTVGTGTGWSAWSGWSRLSGYVGIVGTMGQASPSETETVPLAKIPVPWGSGLV